MRAISEPYEKILDRCNPAFVFVLKRRTTWRVFAWVSLLYCMFLGILFFISTTPIPGQWAWERADFLECGFLLASFLCVGIFGGDYSVVYIETTFKDELFRTTPITPLKVVHGGMLAGFVLSTGFLCLCFFFLGIAWFLHYPVRRAFWSLGVIFLSGQMLGVFFLSYYIKARRWFDIVYAVSTSAFILLALVGFWFTNLGRQFYWGISWGAPLLFLFVVFLVFYVIGYVLAGKHALNPKETLEKAAVLNTCVYLTTLSLFAIASVLL